MTNEAIAKVLYAADDGLTVTQIAKELDRSTQYVRHSLNCEGQGMAQRASNWLMVPLCAQHHTGSKDGWQGQREAWKRAGVDEMDALADTVERLAHV